MSKIFQRSNRPLRILRDLSISQDLQTLSSLKMGKRSTFIETILTISSKNIFGSKITIKTLLASTKSTSEVKHKIESSSKNKEGRIYLLEESGFFVFLRALLYQILNNNQYKNDLYRVPIEIIFHSSQRETSNCYLLSSSRRTTHTKKLPCMIIV